jgi:hypothetical protein
MSPYSSGVLVKEVVDTMRVGNDKELGVDGWSVPKFEETNHQSGTIALVFIL